MSKPKCVVCGARARFGLDTCDGICLRAKHTGIDRGVQVELEARRDSKRPYPQGIHWIDNEQRGGAFLLQLEFDRRMGTMFDRALIPGY